MIRTNYDPEADVLHVAFGPPGVRSDTSEEVAPGVFVEFDPKGNPVGIEVISVRGRSARGCQRKLPPNEPVRHRLSQLPGDFSSTATRLDRHLPL